MPSTPIATKLTLPASRASVPRPRLRALLAQAPRGGLVLVSAPAGFGKTTLVADWLRAAGTAAAWVSLEDRDNDALSFLSCLAAALPSRFSRAAAAMRHLLDQPGPLDARSVIVALVNEASGCGELALVLDDYHVIDETAVHDAVRYLLEGLSSNLRVVVCTRADPPLPVARLRAAGRLVEIRAAQLRFTHAEAMSLLGPQAGPGLSESTVTALNERTGGWIVGLRLAAASLREAPDAAAFLRGFSGSNRFILDYLSDEVLRSQTATTQSFLLHTSILDQLCGPLCDAVTGATDGQETLERLEARNLFLEALDDHRGWYRYHPLLADVLRARLSLLPVEEVRELHRRAAAWCRASGLAAEAVTHAICACDFSPAADGALALGEETLIRGEAALLLRWIDALPAEEITRRPLLRVQRACAMRLLSYPADRIRDCVEEIVSSPGARSLAPEIAAIRANVAYHDNRPRECLALAQKALASLSPDRRVLTNGMNGIIGGLAHAAGDVRTAAAQYAASIRVARATGNQFTAVIFQWRLAELAALQGKLREAEDLSIRACELAASDPNRPLPVVCFPYVLRASIHLERNELDAAASFLDKAQSPASSWIAMGSRDHLATTAVLRCAQRDMVGACAAARAALAMTRTGVDIDADGGIREAQIVRLLVLAGALLDARRWAEENGIARALLRTRRRGPSDHPYFLLYVARVRAYAQLLLAEGAPREAAELIDGVLPEVRARGLRENEVGLLVLRACAEEACGSRPRARGFLARALTLAGEEGALRAFLDALPGIEAILREPGLRGAAQKHAEAVLRAADCRAPRVDAPAPRPDQPLLSSREMVVLQAIARGLSNKEIADHLFVTEQTVKWHAGNIYGKLGVKSRTQAVSRARGLGILGGEGA